jgi:hypothetical protein
MIQRIQSIWLLLASACAFVSLKFSFYSGTDGKGLSSQFLTGSSDFILLLFTAVIGVLALFTIFMFKNRKQQLRLCILGILLEAVLIFLYYRQLSTFTNGTYSLTSLLQVGIILFFILAARGISKDQKLVKESDRLR